MKLKKSLVILDEELKVQEPVLPSKRKVIGDMLVYIVGAYLIFLVLIIVLHYFTNMGEYLSWLQGTLAELFSTRPFFVYGVLLVIYGLSAFLLIPVQTLIGTMALLIVEDVWSCCGFIMLASFLTHTGLYGLFYLTRGHIDRGLSDSELIALVAESSKARPFVAAFALRCVALPVGVIDAILVSVRNPLFSFMVSAILLDLILLVDSNTMRLQAHELSRLLQKAKAGEEISFKEVVVFILLLLMLLSSVLISLALSIWAKRKLRQREEINESGTCSGQSKPSGTTELANASEDAPEKAGSIAEVKVV